MPDNPNIFISASNDNTIRIQSLEQFSELYCFNLTAGLARVNLIDHKIFACLMRDNSIKIGEL